MANAEKQSAAATDKTIYRTGRLVGSVLCKSNRTVVPKVCNTGLYAKGRGIGWPSAVLRESMTKQSEWKNDRKRVAMVLQKNARGTRPDNGRIQHRHGVLAGTEKPKGAV